MTRSALRYSIIGIILFIITLVSSVNQITVLENELASDEINYYITNSFWTLAHIFTYLLFLNRLRNTFIKTKYKISNRIQLFFKLGIFIWTIFELLMALNQCARDTAYYSHKRYHINSLICLFIIQMIDFILSFYLILLFLRNLNKIAFDQKIRIPSTDSENDSKLDVLEMYDTDIIDQVYDINGNDVVNVHEQSSVDRSRSSVSHDNDIEEISSAMSKSHSDYLLLAEDGCALRNGSLGRNAMKNQHKLLNWGTKYCVLFVFAMISTQISLIYSLLWIVINFWIGDKEYEQDMTMVSHYIWTMNMLINTFVIYLDFDFSVRCYNCCCKECHRLCRICCISFARKKLVGMTNNTWGKRKKPKDNFYDADSHF